MKVQSKCVVCGSVDEFEVPSSGFEKRRRGAPMAEAFPDLPSVRIRQLTESICLKCQEELNVTRT